MQTEIEAKFLAINHDHIRAALHKLGAELVQPMRVMKRRNYDFVDRRLDKKDAWVRVRDEGDKITMSFKRVFDRSLTGTHEVNLTIDSFDGANSFLNELGLTAGSYQETKRESWLLDGCQVELDEWPWVKPYVEIEGETESAVKELALKLGLDWTRALHGSVEVVYMAEYDVAEQDVDDWPEITFTPVPDWLEAKRRS